MVKPRKLELHDGELLTWPVQVWLLIALMPVCFATSVTIVCLIFKLIVK